MIVYYGPDHDSHHEWVYNEADIDNAHVVWARAMKDENKNVQLREYFKNRRIEVLKVDFPKDVQPGTRTR